MTKSQTVTKCFYLPNLSHTNNDFFTMVIIFPNLKKELLLA